MENTMQTLLYWLIGFLVMIVLLNTAILVRTREDVGELRAMQSATMLQVQQNGTWISKHDDHINALMRNTQREPPTVPSFINPYSAAILPRATEIRDSRTTKKK